jgi:hypothetical protein
MPWLYPRFPAGQLATTIRITLLGTTVAAVYGAIHDQISYSISSEYFTKMKFRQFAWADLGWPPRLYASVIGALATWWVGLIGGWLLARLGLAQLPAAIRRQAIVRAFGIVFVAAAVSGAIGATIGAAANLAGWADWQRNLELEDLRSFVIVAHLHAGGYIGALAGVILAVVYVRRVRSRL